VSEGRDDILGHRATTERLWSTLARGKLHHAYLFEGPRGVGKSTVALRLAQAANCTDERPVEQRPCGRCDTCRQIASDVHPDVLRLEPDGSRAARTIPVEAVREVIRKTGYHRYSARRRVVIVDPAESMQEGAANALLKTLEEPPDGTGFLVVTHNASALLPTIRSRCQRVRFGAVPEDEIRRWLIGRGVDNALEAARLAQGCPGRALALADHGLAERSELRTGLLQALEGQLDDVYAFSKSMTDGRRQDWTERVEALLEIVEELLRDVAIQGAGAGGGLLNADIPQIVHRWTEALWPDGVEEAATAVQDCRDDLEVFVSGKTAIDALVTTLRRSLGRS
jgi:DNA polymerase-3 subunit delta'